MPRTAAVLFVCLGNICRSPTAEGVFRALLKEKGLLDRIVVDSAGTSDWHIDEAPDRRSQAEALRRGVDLSSLRGRQVHMKDFSTFDYILAMDRENLSNLKRMCPPDHHDRLHLFLDFAHNRSESEVPDPYYGGDQGFARVLDMIEDASTGLLQDMKNRFGL